MIDSALGQSDAEKRYRRPITTLAAPMVGWVTGGSLCVESPEDRYSTEDEPTLAAGAEPDSSLFLRSALPHSHHPDTLLFSSGLKCYIFGPR